MNGITQDQIVKEVNALKTMKRLNGNGRIDELEKAVPHVKAINGKLMTLPQVYICRLFIHPSPFTGV